MISFLSNFRKFMATPRRRAFVSQGGLSYLAQIIEALHGFFVIPLAIIYIGLDGYGWWVTSYGVIQVILLMDGGLSSAFQGHLTCVISNRDSLSINRVLSVMIVFSVSVATLLVAFSTLYVFLAEYYWGPDISKVTGIIFSLFLSGVAGGIAIINSNLGVIGSASLKPHNFFVPLIFARLIALLITVVLFFCGYGIVSIPVGLLVAEIILLANCIYQLRRIGYKYISPDIRLWSEWVGILRLTFLARLASGMYNSLEPTLIGIFAGPNFSGTYVACKKPATLIVKVLSSLWASTISPLVNYSSIHGYKNLASQLTYIYAFFLRASLVGFFLYIILNDQFLKIWVGSYIVGDKYIYIIISALLVTGFVFDVVNESFLILGSPKSVATNQIIISIVRIFIGIGLAFLYGFNGLLWGVVIANLSVIIYVWFNLCKKLDGYMRCADFSVHFFSLWFYMPLIIFYLVIKLFFSTLLFGNIRIFIFATIFLIFFLLLESQSLNKKFDFNK